MRRAVAAASRRARALARSAAANARAPASPSSRRLNLLAIAPDRLRETNHSPNHPPNNHPPPRPAGPWTIPASSSLHSRRFASAADKRGTAQASDRRRPSYASVITPALEARLDAIAARRDALSARLLEDPPPPPREMTTITKDLASSERVATARAALDASRREAADLLEMVDDGDDPELAAEASAELERLEAETLPALENALAHLLLPPDDVADENDAIVEVRAGAGGDEAAIFAGDLVRMYEAHAKRRGWRFALLAASASDVGGGFKEATAEVTGADAYGALKFESGVHRVQRVPATETQGRVHTSTASVAVLPRAEEVDVEISDKDVRVDTMRASGAGGQHVNTTCSAVRVTHLETGIVVVIQDERSQHKNREKAMKVLRSRVYDAALRKSRAERSEKRRSLVGSGDRSERVRTYNYKEGRVKDHRVNVLSNDLAGIMEGGEALAEMMDALREEEKRRALEELMETTE